MRIELYPMDFTASGCYRCLFPAAQLEEQGGHHLTVGLHEIDDQRGRMPYYTLLMPSEYAVLPDLVVLQQPSMPSFCVFMELLQAAGVKVVVELDDDYMNVPSYVKDRTPSAEARDTMGWCIRHADAVTVSTPALRKRLTGVTRAPIYVLRNYLDWEMMWRHVPVVCEGDARAWNRLRIGYLGSTHWRSGDLQILNPWLGRWLADHPDVDFFASDPRTHDCLGVPHQQRLGLGVDFYTFEKVGQYAGRMDLGLVPLARNKFNEAKSHLKGMEYAGAGVPCIATPTESYAGWWLSGANEGPGGAGFLCGRPKEWIHTLDLLYNNRGLLPEMGLAARALAAENTYQKHWRLWENAYLEILEAGSSTRRRFSSAL